MVKVELKKQKQDKTTFNKVVDTEFKTYRPEEIENRITVEEFFNLYEDLYNQIPTEGEQNSHEYLIKRSSEVVNIERDLSEIQPLLDEIDLLRRQLLQANIDSIQNIAQ